MLCAIKCGDAASWVQVIIMFWGFLLTILQLRSSIKDSRAKFWLEVKTHFYEFDDVTTALRPGGKWVLNRINTSEEWSQVDEYLGMFEYCEMLLKRKVIDEKFFKTSYIVQLSNAMGHPQIKEKVKSEAAYWKTLFELCDRLGINV